MTVREQAAHEQAAHEQTGTRPVPASATVEPIDLMPQTGRVGKRTFGVEEELLLVSADSGHPVPAGAEVVEAAQEWLGSHRDHQVDHEFKMEQTEIGSEPCTEPGEMLEQLMELRRTVSALSLIHI